ncbi:MAG: twitching motility protein PilT, partial [Chloroflexi bacterium]|nr:twitching motility protein PilT [Chloroflexota bacterium]
QDAERTFLGTPAVKDMIEATGVPHTEVDLLLVNGESRGFDYRLQDGDRVSVYPAFEALDIAAATRVRPVPLREPRFLLDVHLGRLARLLRLLGFDAAYAPGAEDDHLAASAASERRILLTRDRQLLKRRLVTHAYCLRSQVPLEQAVEVLQRFDLTSRAAPLTRCLRCNGRLQAIGLESVKDRLPHGVRTRVTRLAECLGCRRLYWDGTHYPRLQRMADDMLARAASGPAADVPDRQRKANPGS